MASIDPATPILEDFEALCEAREALHRGNKKAYQRLVKEIEQEIGAEYSAQLDQKIRRWVEATVMLHFFDRPPVRYYIQAKMLYRDGFYEATVMLCRSVAEMICYDRLEGAVHPFGAVQEVEKRNFRELLRWLHQNDPQVSETCFRRLNELYDIGNNYVHPKSGQASATDSIKTLHLLGESLTILYGPKSLDEMVGRTLRSAYLDFPDINSGQNFLLTGFATPEAIEAHLREIAQEEE